ncbi:MAG: DNA primase, partial [Spiribacter salinus]
MPRYPSELIERVKREAPIRTWLEGRGAEFHKHGRDVVCRCPFPDHEDRTPSFVVSEDRNLWHCLGACQAGGSVVDLVMRLEGCDFRAAVETLLAAFPHLAGEAPAGPAPARGKVPLITPTMADDEILAAVMRYYHHRLPAVREASAYLERRGISQAAIDHFK